MRRPTLDSRAGPPHPAARFLNTVQRPRVRWLWPRRLPLGCLSLLIGDPGVGKSLLTADLAARLTVPRPWPDDPADERPDPTEPAHLADSTIRGFTANQIPPAGVLFAAPEDHDALPERLAVAGVAPHRVSILDGVRPPFTDDLLPLRLPAHAPQLQEAISAHDHPRLAVLDPLHLLLDDGVFSSPDLQIGLLSRLAAIARHTGVAILAVGHFAKDPARRVFYRIRGSLSVVAAARSILLITPDPDIPDRRVLTQIKSTYGPLAPPLAFRIVPTLASRPDAPPRLEWDDPNSHDWRLATGDLDLSPESFSVLSETCDWLTDFLSDGPRPAREVLSAARAAGIPRSTLFRAKRLLQIPSRKTGTTWTWLPPPAM